MPVSPPERLDQLPRLDWRYGLGAVDVHATEILSLEPQIAAPHAHTVGFTSAFTTADRAAAALTSSIS